MGDDIFIKVNMGFLFKKVFDFTRRLFENALFCHIFVKLEKIIFGILTIYLR